MKTNLSAVGALALAVLMSFGLSRAEADTSTLDQIDFTIGSNQGGPAGQPHQQATYLFKHALVQDAAYDTLLREPRRALRACIAYTLQSRFAEIAENQPELLVRH